MELKSNPLFNENLTVNLIIRNRYVTYSIKRFANVTKSMNKLVNKAKKEIIEAANTKNKKIARKVERMELTILKI